jgi:hypothetical protein
MSAPNAIRSQYSHLYGSSMLPVLEEIFYSELDMHPSRRQDLFRILSTDRDIWQATEIHDLDLFQSMNEGQEYSYSRPLQGASKTLTIQKYGRGFSVSKEMIADGKFSLVGDMARKLAKSARESQEINAMSPFNNGFTGGSETTADGVTVFNSAHTLPSGGTFRNVLSTAADLSVTSLEQMLQDFETQFVGDSGIIYNPKAKILLVHPSNKRKALELIGSDLKADSADNNMNSFKSEGLRVVSSPHLTDSDAWFMLSDPSEHGLRIVVREALSTSSKEVFDTDSVKYKASYREVIGATVAYGVFGSAGA